MTHDSKGNEAAAEAVHVPDEELLPAYSEDAAPQAGGSHASDNGECSNPTKNGKPAARRPTVDACLSHLKLLRAFEVLKQKVGYTDGLWNIWDSRAKGSIDVLAKLREKRWAIYIARAVDRYEAWWKSFVPSMLIEKDMLQGMGVGDGGKYQKFPSAHDGMNLIMNILPPPDILLVWHTHMLNPRIFLEDCLRYGHGTLWNTSLPWNAINLCINADYEFTASEEGKLNWSTRTNLEWTNQDDKMHKEIKCPVCFETKLVPWTTCGQSEDSQGKPGLVGQGFGDGELRTECKRCGTTIDEELLRVAKFRDDLKNLITKDWPMPGTIIDVKTGLIKPQESNSDQLFPNRLVRLGLLVEVTNALEPGTSVRPDIAFIRDKIEVITRPAKYRHSNDELKKIDKGISGVSTIAHHNLSRAARLQTRCMMSRYWTNSSMFGLDLKGAVLRQGVFCEKMFKINWLQSPTSTFTMERLLKKYERFFEIAAKNPSQFITPTLDVDLAWHTHQLNPPQYFAYTVEVTGTFTDHNDKVDEDKLAVSFDWMVKTYQEQYGEAYSECACWFCESLRYPIKKKPKAPEEWQTSGSASAEPPHISSHPAMHCLSERNGARRTERYLFHNDLDASHEKMLKQSVGPTSKKDQKKSTFSSIFKSSSSSQSPLANGSTTIIGSRGQDRAAHWGQSVTIPGPWASSTHVALTEKMYASPPGALHESLGKPGTCARGTCGGEGGCGNGAVVMCGIGCTGSGKNIFGPGCVGAGA